MTTLLVDMDELLVDFRGSAYRIHGKNREEVERITLEAGVWGMDEALGITDAEFWKPIQEAGHLFWLHLQPLPWWQDLLALAREYTKDWYIVTSPSKCPSSTYGKALWAQQHLGEDYHRLIPTRHKHLFANEHTILIDDRQETVDRFIGAGGDAILFPSVGNKLHYLRHDPLEYVKQQLFVE